jgi:two-component system chemotaxis sensor kinase CheA
MTQTLLVFSSSGDDRMALPLSEIARLEEFDPQRVEHTGRFEVVQYRDEIMPLVRLAEVLETMTPSTADPDGAMQVIVVSHEGQHVGLIVDRIVDIVECTVSVQQRKRPGVVLGSAVVQGRVTDILDIRRLVRDVDEEFLTPAGMGADRHG